MSANAADWRAKAEADFHSAVWELQAPAPNYDAVVFHAQQCVEKLLKGLLVAAVADAHAAIPSCTRLRAALLPLF